MYISRLLLCIISIFASWKTIDIILFIINKIMTWYIVIYKHKEFAKKLRETNVLNEILKPMTDEEKEQLKKTGRAETKINIDPDTLEIKK